MKIDIEYVEETRALVVQNSDGVLDHRLGDTVYLKKQIVFRITRLWANRVSGWLGLFGCGEDIVGDGMRSKGTEPRGY